MNPIKLDYKKLGLIDNRNELLINQIENKDIFIDLEQRNSRRVPYWSMNYDAAGKIAHIYVGKNRNDINGFTHELLHVVEELNGQFPHEVLPVLIALNDSIFKILFTDYVVSH